MGEEPARHKNKLVNPLRGLAYFFVLWAFWFCLINILWWGCWIFLLGDLVATPTLTDLFTGELEQFQWVVLWCAALATAFHLPVEMRKDAERKEGEEILKRLHKKMGHGSSPANRE